MARARRFWEDEMLSNRQTAAYSDTRHIPISPNAVSARPRLSVSDAIAYEPKRRIQPKARTHVVAGSRPKALNREGNRVSDRSMAWLRTTAPTDRLRLLFAPRGSRCECRAFIANTGSIVRLCRPPLVLNSQVIHRLNLTLPGGQMKVRASG